MLKLRKRRPLLSVIVVFHNMRREAQRTLFALTSQYQVGVSPSDYEVIAVDSNSTEPLDSNWVQGMQEGFTHHTIKVTNPSPCRAVNFGAQIARGELVSIMIDGARIPTPHLLQNFLKIAAIDPSAFTYTLGMHIGHKRQNISMQEGYCQHVEDKLISSSNWEIDGYQLFNISCLAGSSQGGYFSDIAESNCFCLSRNSFDRLGRYDERFISRGGGFVNLDFFRIATQDKGLNPWLLLGEATFHQFHGGVATNTPENKELLRTFRDEYHAIRGEEYTIPHVEPQYFGKLPRAIRSRTMPVKLS